MVSLDTTERSMTMATKAAIDLATIYRRTCLSFGASRRRWSTYRSRGVVAVCSDQLQIDPLVSSDPYKFLSSQHVSSYDHSN